ncbi:serine/threonine-protein kinase VRK1-like isoform X2 [Amphibalanus amphitrite]|uniref:serine/threonine-protein kinase VRK1-like isoform X2 n=1 Tax=Amphibalanus amphitrite TaxID=1232801 RepID=UPI001C9114D5|nr:serine/threonine-protein kinase VRK1-like isoform X2 [Amphibalanus amphitrite]
MPVRKCRGGGGGGGPPSPARRAAAGHRLPAPLPAGLTLTDVSQQRWRLGRSIGSGGFGEIYSAARDSSAEASHAIKVEPHWSGPLFSEMHCYHRVGRADTIAAWQRARRLRRLGMPRFVGSGSVEHAGERYRFMVMDRFGSDLQRLLDRHGGRFPFGTALTIGLQVLDTLEYIHSREYIHADIKAQNLLLGYKRGTENQVYLVDFGLACRYSLNGRHKPYGSDLRKAHDGTIEFTSRDAHIGAHSRRGDLEILGYNLLQWTAGRLPWQHLLHDADLVAAEKNRHMRHIPGLVYACYGDSPPPEAEVLAQYMQMVSVLGFDTAPDYDALRDVLRAGAGPSGAGCARLEFSCAAAAAAAAKAGPAGPRWRRRAAESDPRPTAGRRGAVHAAATGDRAVLRDRRHPWRTTNGGRSGGRRHCEQRWPTR